MRSFDNLKMTGDYRPGKHGDCILPVEPPPTPGDLQGPGLAFWNVVSQCAVEAGTITRVDGTSLRLLADSWSLYLQCCDHIAEHGIVVVSHTSQGETWKQNPACQVRSKVWAELFTGLQKFGLNPRGRIGIHTGGQAGQSEEEAQVMALLFGWRN